MSAGSVEYNIWHWPHVDTELVAFCRMFLWLTLFVVIVPCAPMPVLPQQSTSMQPFPSQQQQPAAAASSPYPQQVSRCCITLVVKCCAKYSRLPCVSLCVTLPHTVSHCPSFTPSHPLLICFMRRCHRPIFNSSNREHRKTSHPLNLWLRDSLSHRRQGFTSKHSHQGSLRPIKVAYSSRWDTYPQPK